MSIQLIYLVKLLLLPPAGFLILMAAGWLMRKKKMGDVFMITAWLGLLLMSLPWTVKFLAEKGETVPALKAERVKTFEPQAVVVIGGGIKKSGEDYVLTTRTLARLQYAAQLAKQTGLPVLVSGGRVLATYPVSEAEIMAKTLNEQWHIRPKWLEKNSRNTAENARLSHQILQQSGVTRIILVTQAYHMSRALTQFEKAGFSVLPAPMDFIASREPATVFDFIPSAFAVQKNYLLLHEWLGRLWYRLRY